MKQFIPSLVVSFLVIGVLPAGAQQKPTAPVETTQRSSGEQTPLRVQVVVSRHQGEKKISSIPYTLAVVANDRPTSVRMKMDVPVPQTVFSGGGPNTSIPQTSYNYRSVGTDIDCAARSMEGGLFKLELGISDTGVILPEKQGTAPSTTVPGAPAYRSFTSTFSLLLRDGQTAQHTAATDPVSGEVLRVDVTMTVLK